MAKKYPYREQGVYKDVPYDLRANSERELGAKVQQRKMNTIGNWRFCRRGRQER